MDSDNPNPNPNPNPSPNPNPNQERQDAEDTLKSGGSELKGGWPLVIEAFTLTTVAEIGDRSQLATIALSAAGNPNPNL